MKPTLSRASSRPATVSRAVPAAVQLEWDLSAAPAPRSRFLEFPLTGETALPPTVPAPARTAKRPLAA